MFRLGVPSRHLREVLPEVLDENHRETAQVKSWATVASGIDLAGEISGVGDVDGDGKAELMQHRGINNASFTLLLRTYEDALIMFLNLPQLETNQSWILMSKHDMYVARF
ncbi:MAG TPA: hypothetical protein VFR18_03690 [Terriglobia bacterium]|nr:hypothetical protein [Terriglobia bacterium]